MKEIGKKYREKNYVDRVGNRPPWSGRLALAMNKIFDLISSEAVRQGLGQFVRTVNGALLTVGWSDFGLII